MASQLFQLVMGSGPHPGKIYEITESELTIGRDISNNIVINDPEVSRRHVRLTAQAGAYVIEDLGSTNGTFVDGQRLMGPHTLRSGETIMLGEKVSMKYEQAGYDPDATLIGASIGTPAQPASRETYRIPPFEEEQEPAPPPAPQQDVYVAPRRDAYPAPIPQTEYVEPVPEYKPAYSGQVPPGPAEDAYASPAAPYAESYEAEFEDEDRKKKTRTWILAGCGCLLVVLCICAVGAYAFDSANLYCEAPFDILFGDMLGLCP